MTATLLIALLVTSLAITTFAYTTLEPAGRFQKAVPVLNFSTTCNTPSNNYVSHLPTEYFGEIIPSMQYIESEIEYTGNFIWFNMYYSSYDEDSSYFEEDVSLDVMYPYLDMAHVTRYCCGHLPTGDDIFFNDMTFDFEPYVYDPGVQNVACPVTLTFGFTIDQLAGASEGSGDTAPAVCLPESYKYWLGDGNGEYHLNVDVWYTTRVAYYEKSYGSSGGEDFAGLKHVTYEKVVTYDIEYQLEQDFVYGITYLAPLAVSITDSGVIGGGESYAPGFQISLIDMSTLRTSYALSNDPVYVDWWSSSGVYVLESSARVDILNQGFDIDEGPDYYRDLPMGCVSLIERGYDYIYEDTGTTFNSFQRLSSTDLPPSVNLVDSVEYDFLGWLVESVGSFLATPIFGDVTLGAILGVIVAVPLAIWILKLFAGG